MSDNLLYFRDRADADRADELWRLERERGLTDAEKAERSRILRRCGSYAEVRDNGIDG